MKIEIDDDEIRLRSPNGQSLRIHAYESGDTTIISFEICKDGICGSGNLPAVEFGTRDTLLRHIGNRIEVVQ